MFEGFCFLYPSIIYFPTAVRERTDTVVFVG